MPYPFALPTTSAFSFSSCFNCESHPSLPLNTSTYRGVVRDTLKKHKRLPPGSQAANLSLVISSINGYVPYLFAVDAGLSGRSVGGEPVTVVASTALKIEWRPTLSENLVPGKEAGRVKIHSLGHEGSFALSTLANAYTLQARAALQPLYVTTVAPVGSQERQAAITTASKHLLDAAAVYGFLEARAAQQQQQPPPPPPCADISPPVLRAQAALAHAEATLLAVLKDDPYPAVVAQDRNRNDTEWMYKAPDIPKVRAHLFARLCLAAAEHAALASSLCQGVGRSRLSDAFVRYIDDLRRTSRAKACRFFGIDADLGGQGGQAIGWLRAGLLELGVEVKNGGGGGKKSGGLGLGKLKREWSEKREDRRVEKGESWGADAGKLEETRVLEMLEAKWSKQNDTVRLSLGVGVGVGVHMCLFRLRGGWQVGFAKQDSFLEH